MNPTCFFSDGAEPSIEHAAEYHSWLPSFDVHYMLQRNWSVYGQAARGQNIPPTSVFDVKNGAVAVLPWLFTMLVFLVMVTYIPEISLWLPRALGML